MRGFRLKWLVWAFLMFISIPGRAMGDQRTASQEQGSATLSKEQIELIGVVLEPRFEKVVADMRLAIKEEVERVRGEMKDEVRDQIQAQSNHFYWVIGILVTIGLAAGGLAVHKWPQAVPVAAAAPTAAATATPEENR